MDSIHLPRAREEEPVHKKRLLSGPVNPTGAADGHNYFHFKCPSLDLNGESSMYLTERVWPVCPTEVKQLSYFYFLKTGLIRCVMTP